MKTFCWMCNKDINNKDKYNITLLNYAGNQFSVYCCSKECCIEAKSGSAKIHEDRYEFVMNKKPHLCTDKKNQ